MTTFLKRNHSYRKLLQRFRHRYELRDGIPTCGRLGILSYTGCTMGMLTRGPRTLSFARATGTGHLESIALLLESRFCDSSVDRLDNRYSMGSCSWLPLQDTIHSRSPTCRIPRNHWVTALQPDDLSRQNSPHTNHIRQVARRNHRSSGQIRNLPGRHTPILLPLATDTLCAQGYLWESQTPFHPSPRFPGNTTPIQASLHFHFATGSTLRP